MRKILHLSRNKRILVPEERPTDRSARDCAGLRIGCREKEHEGY